MVARAYIRLVRRILGLLTMSMMLHLSLVGTDFACAKHAHAINASMPGMPNHQGHPLQSHGEGTGDCHTPISPDCCSAITSCSTTIGPVNNSALNPILRRREHHRWATRELALSRVAAPETPPPRA